MANLNTNELNDIYLSTFISDTDQIVEYVEEISANLIERMNSLEPKKDNDDYTAFEVFPTDKVIPAGTIDNFDALNAIFNWSEAEIKYITDNNIEFTEIPYTYQVDANSELFLEFYIKNTDKQIDLSIDWGDGNVEAVTEEHIRSDNVTININHIYDSFKPTIVKIFGSNYYMVRNSSNFDSTKKSIIRKIFSYKYPLASCVTYVSAICKKSYHLLKIDVPSIIAQQLKVVCNAFQECRNLVDVSFNNGNPIQNYTEIQAMFLSCDSLSSTNIKLPSSVTYYNSYKKIFSYCENLSVDVLNILPLNGFLEQNINLIETFRNCKKIYCSDYNKLADMLWNNNNLKFIMAGTQRTSKCFIKSSLDLAKIPKFFGGNLTCNTISACYNIDGTDEYIEYIDPDYLPKTEANEISTSLNNRITNIEEDYLSKEHGGIISAEISISGDLSTTNNIIAGTNNIVGCNGLKIVGIDKQNLNLSCQYSGTLDILSAAIKDQEFTLVSNGSQGCDAIVLDVNKTNEQNVFQLSISKWYTILDNAIKFSPYYLTFINNPSFGDELELIDTSYCFGYNNKAFGYMCLAEGRDNMCIGNYAHAEGRGTIASWGAHAEGHLTYAERAGSHAEGKQTRAEGYSSHAEGHSVSAIGDFSHAAGVKTNAKDNGSFVWQGVNASGNRVTDDFSNIPIYESHGLGTFNIKPLSGIDGFFIDDKKINEQFPLLVDGKIKTANLPVVDYVPDIDPNKLEYIENTDNTFFIDTGIPVAALSNCTTEITFMINQPVGGIFGYRTDASAPNNYGIQINTDKVIYITPGNSTQRLQINNSNFYVSKKLKAFISINRRALYEVDTNTLIGETNDIVSTTFSLTSTCYLFGFNGANMSEKQMDGRIYDVKIYENESKNVLWHFIPYMDMDTKEIGFYDIANKKWIYKQAQSETFKRSELVYNEYDVDMINMKSQIKDAIDLKNNFAQHIISAVKMMSEDEINDLKTALGLS